MQKNLSVFIDESGDFGKYDSRSPYYLVTFLFHDQTSAIDAELFKLETHLSNIGHAKHVLHTGPLIRKIIINGLSKNQYNKI